MRPGDYHYTGSDGTVMQRRRPYNPSTSELARIDLDAMSRDKLYAFLASWGPAEGITAWAQGLFPLRPVHYLRAARMLYRMARLKLKDTRKSIADYEATYRRLPPYAQFRREFNPAACMSGK